MADMSRLMVSLEQALTHLSAKLASERTRALSACCDALDAAADFFAVKAEHAAGFSFPDAHPAHSQYRDGLFPFDQRYRHFHTMTYAVESMGRAGLHELRAAIEGAYSGWYIPQLSVTWAKVLERPSGLLSYWMLPDVTQQQRLFLRRR